MRGVTLTLLVFLLPPIISLVIGVAICKTIEGGKQRPP